MITCATKKHRKVDTGNQFREEDPTFRYFELKMMMDCVSGNAL